MSRLVMIANPHPGGTYIWVVVPDEPELSAAAEPEPEAEL